MTYAGLLTFLPHAVSNGTFTFGILSQVKSLVARIYLVTIPRVSQHARLAGSRD